MQNKAEKSLMYIVQCNANLRLSWRGSNSSTKLWKLIDCSTAAAYTREVKSLRYNTTHIFYYYDIGRSFCSKMIN